MQNRIRAKRWGTLGLLLLLLVCFFCVPVQAASSAEMSGEVSGEETGSTIASVVLSKTEYVYNGKEKTPSVTVYDENGRKISSAYYTVSYRNNKKVGKAAVTITGCEGMEGTAEKTFRIRPRASTIRDVTAVENQITVKWKKISSQTDGYQIQAATNRKFTKNVKTRTVKDPAVTSKSIGKLLSQTKYYIRIRTYRTVSGVRYYSDWSETQSVRTKKTGELVTKAGKTYYRYEDGSRAKKKFVTRTNGKTYYFNASGEMATGWLKKRKEYYYLDRETGVLAKGKTVDGVTLDREGKAVQTTFSISKMDTMITARKIMMETVNDQDTKPQKLQKVFNWVLKHPYRRYRTLKSARSSKTWMMTFANDVYKKGNGCCVSEACAFSFLAKEVGYQPYVCDDTGHAWTEIDGKVYDTLFAEAKSYSKYYGTSYRTAKLYCYNRTKI